MDLKKSLMYIVTAMLAGAAIAATPASAAVNCGDSVKHDVKLRADLDCTGLDTDGLVIAKNGVTIDLNGHSVLGTGIFGRVGLRNDGYRDMTVRDGSVHGFNGAIAVDDAVTPRIENVKVNGDESSQYGISLSYTLGADVAKVRAKHLDYGLVIQHGDRNRAFGVRARDVATGVYVFDEANSRFAGMTFHTVPDGIGVNDTVGAGNHYRDITVKDPDTYYGFLIDSPQGVSIERSVASNTRFAGLYIQNNDRSDGYGAKVTRTEADDNALYGMYAVSKGTKASENSAEGNGLTDCFQIKCG